MNREKILSVLEQLYTISGFRVSLHNTAFEEIAAYPSSKCAFCTLMHTHSAEEYERCRECDKAACEEALNSGKTYIYRCHNGLIEAVSPLYNFGALTGFLMMGQVKTQPIPRSVTAKLGAENAEECMRLANDVPEIPEDKLTAFIEIMTICARYLTLSNAVTSEKPGVAELTMRYIQEYYTDRISIKDICDSVGYSKSTVLTQFKKEFHTTVNNYLNSIRLEHSKKMLENSDRTVSEIALDCGFSDQSYFSKMFSAKFGKTPTDYRRGH